MFLNILVSGVSSEMLHLSRKTIAIIKTAVFPVELKSSESNSTTLGGSEAIELDYMLRDGTKKIVLAWPLPLINNNNVFIQKRKKI